MHVSLNEIETMGKRAARGAGLPWGIAEETGKAARWLTVRHLSRIARLAHILSRHDQRNEADLAPIDIDDVWQARFGDLCPLIAGAALCDRAAEIADGRTIELAETAEPLWLAPFVAGAAELTDAAISIAWNDVVITLSNRGKCIEGSRSDLTASRTLGVICRLADQSVDPDTPATLQALPVDAEDWNRLAAFAQRIYAPATEASRLSGAGAGLTDNN
ncbi:MAG: DUF3726 domain-containing protein [Pseudomonadota bacterium]